LTNYYILKEWFMKIDRKWSQLLFFLFCHESTDCAI